jgi:hypothetical protein
VILGALAWLTHSPQLGSPARAGRRGHSRPRPTRTASLQISLREEALLR